MVQGQRPQGRVPPVSVWADTFREDDGQYARAQAVEGALARDPGEPGGAEQGRPKLEGDRQGECAELDQRPLVVGGKREGEAGDDRNGEAREQLLAVMGGAGLQETAEHVAAEHRSGRGQMHRAGRLHGDEAADGEQRGQPGQRLGNRIDVVRDEGRLLAA